MEQMYIDGRLVAGSSAHVVVSPATREDVATVAWAGVEDAERALQAAQRAFPAWSTAAIDERAGWMARLREAVVRDERALRTCVQQETGKTWEQTAEDHQSLVDSLAFYAEEVRRFGPEALPDRHGSHAHELVHEPVGVAVAFIAWNFPLLNLAFKLGPALAAGCPIVIKPSVKSPLAAYAVGALCHEIGLPPGVVNILCGDDDTVGDALSASTIPALLTLIGSTRTARRIMERGASSIKRYSMELGGNAPVLVFADADLDLAADTIAALKFGNAGQVCVAPNRVFVHADVADGLRERLVRRAEAVRVGYGPEATVDMGPLIDDAAARRVGGLVEEAVRDGAQLLTGGGRPAGVPAGSFFAPTVLSDVTPAMRVCAEEVFGPVVSVRAFDDEEDVLAEANATEAGLTAYVFTADAGRATRCASRLRFGEVQINGVKYDIDLPHGGIKQSGLGHDCSHLALRDYLAPKRVTRALAAEPEAPQAA